MNRWIESKIDEKCGQGRRHRRRGLGKKFGKKYSSRQLRSSGFETARSTQEAVAEKSVQVASAVKSFVRIFRMLT